MELAAPLVIEPAGHLRIKWEISGLLYIGAAAVA
jgi:hypothetical protein